jgi:hypothetical protein
LLSDSPGAWLSDVEPLRHVYLLEIELEEWVVVDGLDHPADVASGDQLLHQGRGRPVRHLVGERADAELIVGGTRQGMDHAARVSPKVPALG